MEIWKDIPGYDGKYQANNLGDIRSTNYKRTGKTQLLSKRYDKGGYLYVGLFEKGQTRMCKIHRLVLLTFIGPSDLEVNHKNGIRDDNSLENLEYCTHQENVQHSFKELGRKGANAGKYGKEHYRSKKIKQYDLDGNFIKIWDSMMDIFRELGIHQPRITAVCKGRKKTTGGYIWKYV